MHQYRISMTDPTDLEIAAILDQHHAPWRVGMFTLDAEPMLLKDAHGIELVAMTLAGCLADVNKHSAEIHKRVEEVAAQARDRGEDPDAWAWRLFAVSDDARRQVVFLED